MLGIYVGIILHHIPAPPDFEFLERDPTTLASSLKLKDPITNVLILAIRSVTAGHSAELPLYPFSGRSPI
jgi:hypothetical protein